MICPPHLKIGDRVALTAPASKLEIKSVEIAVEILSNSWGLEVVVGDTIGKSFFEFAATDEERLNELQRFLDDPSIRLILAARGGYGCSKIIDKLNFDKFYDQPKWLCGFSDLTALLLHLNSLGFQAVHGVMAKTMIYDQASNETLHKILFGQTQKYSLPPHDLNKTGTAVGQAIGGNLCLLAHSIGSKSDISYDGKILFLEDISEYYYNLDRMLLQLKRARKLDNLAGLVIGDFSDCKENDLPFGKDIYQIVLDHVSPFNYPLAFNFKFGHEHENYAVSMGAELKLEVTKNQTTITI